MARRTCLTNLELAENPTWVIASTFIKCPFCGFLSREPSLDRPSVPCPRCNRSGSARSVFPGYACVDWLKMIGDAYVRAAARSDAKRNELAEAIRPTSTRDIKASEVVAAAGAIRRFFRKPHRSETEYQNVLGVLQRDLSVGSQEQAVQVFSLLASYSNTSIDHTLVVILTASLFERLLHDLLVQQLVGRGMKDGEARKTVGKRRRREELQELFWLACGTPLQRAIGEFGVPNINEAWQSIADRRNKFLHITSRAISAEMAERAFNTAKVAFPLFAFLQNKYCVAKIPCASG